MKDLLADLGHLVAFRKLNRDELAQRIGSTRQNLISAFKGRRSLPTPHMPPLRQALGLDETYRFEPGRVHALNAEQGEKQRDLLHSLLRRFMTLPVRNKWLLRGIGEGGRSGFAYIYEDSQGALIAVRNDDALLGALGTGVQDATENGAQASKSFDELVSQAAEEILGMANLFSRTDDSPEREIPLDAFNTLFADGMSVEDLRAALQCAAKVWTWTRLREKADIAGISASEAAKRLGL